MLGPGSAGPRTLHTGACWRQALPGFLWFGGLRQSPALTGAVPVESPQLSPLLHEHSTSSTRAFLPSASSWCKCCSWGHGALPGLVCSPYTLHCTTHGQDCKQRSSFTANTGGKKKSVLSRGRDGEIILTQVVKVGMRIIDFEVFLFPLKIGQQTMDIKWYFFTNQLLRPLCSC